MSAIENRREVAYRLFAAEFDDATLSYSEGDEERAPNYVVTPTGARVNRLFAVGALTEVESVNEEVLRGRVADPTDVFVTYAGQYQPEAMNFLDRSTPPMFVSLTGKARTYEPEDSDRVFTSVRPESINEVDAATRDRWVVAAARATLERVATMRAASALDHRGDDLRAVLEARGVDESLATGVPLAIDHYGTTEHYLEAVRTMAVQALELVAGERDAVDSLTVAPDEAGPDGLGPLPDVPAATPPEGGDVAITEARESAPADGLTTDDDAEAETADAGATDAETTAESTTETTGTETTSDAGTTPDADAATGGTDEAPGSDDAVASSPAGTADGTETPTETESATGTESNQSEPEPTATETTETKEPAHADASEPETATPEPSETADPDPAESTASTTAESPTDADAGDDSEPARSSGLGDFDAGGSDEPAAETDDADDPGGLGDFDAGDAATADAGDDEPAADADAAATGEMYEMDEEERAEIEAEFGAEFSTGNEVDDPGEADIDVPDADDLEAQAAEANAGTNGEAPTDGDSAAEPAAPPEDARPDTQSPDAAAADSPDGAVADDVETPDEAQTAAGDAVPASSDGDTDESAGDDEPAGADESGDADAGGDADESAADVDLEDAVVEVMADLDDGDGADREAVVSAIVDRYGADAGDVEDAIQDALMSGKCYEPSEGTLKSI
jgi:hypothetical protein